jgi:hypothetical protein
MSMSMKFYFLWQVEGFVGPFKINELDRDYNK